MQSQEPDNNFSDIGKIKEENKQLKIKNNDALERLEELIGFVEQNVSYLITGVENKTDPYMAPGQIYVNIFGTDYSLVSDNNEEYLKEIARYLDDKMREIDRSQNLKSVSKVAILAALNIVEELFQEREYREKLVSEINEEARNMNNSLSELLENR